MQVEYKNSRIEKICTDAHEAERRYGKAMAGKIKLRMDQIKSAISVEIMMQFKMGRCHPLKGNRETQYAMDLVHPYRLVFEKKGNEVQIANIMEIVNYHK